MPFLGMPDEVTVATQAVTVTVSAAPPEYAAARPPGARQPRMVAAACGQRLTRIWILATSDIGVLPDIGVSDIGFLPISEFLYPISVFPISGSLRYRRTGTPILIPISGCSDIGTQNYDIEHSISDIGYNIGYNIGQPDIGVQ